MPISSLLINFVLLVGMGTYLYKFPKVRLVALNFIGVASFFGSFWLLGTAFFYLFTPVFYDHAEANIASVGMNWILGGPIYTALDSASSYSLLYGPWPFIFSGWLQSAGGSAILMSKLAGILNLLGILLAFYCSLKTLSLSCRQRWLGVSVVGLLLLDYYNFSYWNRPDTYLTAYAGLALVLVVCSNRINHWLVAVGVGILAGLATNCKLHGAVYFLPTVIFYFESYRHSRHLSLKVLVGLAAFFFGVVGPFLLPHVGSEFYLDWIRMASKHGIVGFDLVKNMTYIGSYLLLAYWLGVFSKNKATFGALCFSGFLISVAASKPGAGFNHYMPLIPLIFFLVIREYTNLKSVNLKKAQVIAAAFLLTITLDGINRQKRVVQLLKEHPVRSAEFQDLQEVTRELSGPVELGYADENSYASSFYKPYLVSRGFGLLMDGASIMDLRAAGLGTSQATVDVIKQCQIPVFIFPKDGEPWSMVNFYGRTPLFSEDFKEVFKETYELSSSSKFYSIYKCRDDLP